MGLEWVQIWPQNDPRIDPDMTLPDWSSDGPQTPISRPQISHAQNKDLFDTFITFAERITLPSKDWIAPPSQSQECNYGR